mmetsp:Transcript_14529/g.50605  ORF Transcript_14529/g.50605 Transcript_14529/m.50605 type:complete len:273 (-) Transcript_14529:155-973(-)
MRCARSCATASRRLPPPARRWSTISPSSGVACRSSRTASSRRTRRRRRSGCSSAAGRPCSTSRRSVWGSASTTPASTRSTRCRPSWTPAATVCASTRTPRRTSTSACPPPRTRAQRRRVRSLPPSWAPPTLPSRLAACSASTVAPRATARRTWMGTGRARRCRAPRSRPRAWRVSRPGRRARASVRSSAATRTSAAATSGSSSSGRCRRRWMSSGRRWLCPSRRRLPGAVVDSPSARSRRPGRQDPSLPCRRPLRRPTWTASVRSSSSRRSV